MKVQAGKQPDWSKVGDHAHLVQFYEDEAALVPLLSRYIGTALVGGDAAVVVTTAAVRTKVADHLAGRGFDVAVARAQNRYFDLDAVATMRQILRGGVPDKDRFNRVVEPLIVRAAGSGRQVSAFGSMVDVLCSKGQIDAAIQLEELWNQLARKHPFTLACAYRMSRFSNARHAAPFVRICSQHSHVFSAGRR
jgi:DcmR-like sensory protein